MSRLSRLGCRPSQGNQVTDDQAMDFIQMIPGCGCWIWLGSVKTGGYGYVMRNGKRISMHRLSWTRFRGPIPDGLFVGPKAEAVKHKEAKMNTEPDWSGTCENCGASP